MHAAPIHIGTSGWIYPHWKERFYPRGMPQADWLRYYAEHFGTVEVNNSFYRKPTPSAVAAWELNTPAGFHFAVKMWRGISHYRRLKESRDLLDRCLPILQKLSPHRRGPLLVQLRSDMKPDADRLDRFLEDLRAASDRAGWRVAVEFRNLAWLRPDVRQALDRHDAALCLHDMPGSAITEPWNAGFVYIRRHGSGPEGRYSRRQIDADARAIARWSTAGRDVFIYYNNDLHAHAIANAGELSRAVAALQPLAPTRTGALVAEQRRAIEP